MLHRLDGTQLASVRIAEGKALTAVEFRRPTKAMEDVIAGGGVGLKYIVCRMSASSTVASQSWSMARLWVASACQAYMRQKTLRSHRPGPMPLRTAPRNDVALVNMSAPGRAPRRRESSVEEDSTRRVVD